MQFKKNQSFFVHYLGGLSIYATQVIFMSYEVNRYVKRSLIFNFKDLISHPL
jgi:hypothetical protein